MLLSGCPEYLEPSFFGFSPVGPLTKSHGFRHDSMQTDFYKYIDVCAVTKYLLDATWGLQLLQEAQFITCIPS